MKNLVALTLSLLLFPLAAQAQYAEPLPPWGTGESRGEDLRILLVTFGPGPVDDVASWFGHGALVVEDARLHEGRLYNYGMFNFDSTMLLRFVMGRLEFWVGDADVGGTLRLYRSLNRDVRIQELNLNPAAKVQMAKGLADNVLPQNREYLYHHYFDNCSTRPRDVIDRATGGRLHEAMSGPGRMTLRDHTRRHTAVFAPMSVLLDFWMNDEIDKPIARWDEAFLPSELEHQLDEVKVPDAAGQLVPLVAKEWTFYRSSRPETPAQPPRYGPWLLALGVLLGAIALLAGRFLAFGGRARRWVLGLHSALLGLVFGVPGTALFAMWAFTEHTVTWRNENLFLASPLTLLALPLGLSFIRGKSVKTPGRLTTLWLLHAALGLLGLLLKLFPPFDQDNWRLIALILPVSTLTAAAFFLDARARRAEKNPASAPASPAKAETSQQLAS